MEKLFPHFRKRRSARLYLKMAEGEAESGQNSSKKAKQEILTSVATKFGSFTLLPTELQHLIFSRLSAVDLSILSLTSKAMAVLIEDYRLTRRGRVKFMLEQNTHYPVTADPRPSTMIQDYYRIGIYMKRSTCLFSTSKRLRLMSSYLEKMLCKEEKFCDQTKCISLFCYGTFLHTVIAGWDDLECHRVLDYVTQSALIPKFLSKILQSNPGDYQYSELFVRCFYRRVFIDVLRKKNDKAFWLCNILKPLPMVYQARVLQMLFLPKSAAGVSYYPLPEDRLELHALEELGNSLLMLAESYCWNDDNIISVIDEIVVSPMPWYSENISSLLLHCGQTITVKYMISKAINNRVEEIVVIAQHLIMSSLRGNGTIKPASQIIWSLVRQLKNYQKSLFVTHLLDIFKSSIVDLNEYGADMYYELEAVVEGLTQFSKELVEIVMDVMETTEELPATTKSAEFTKLTDTLQEITHSEE